MDFGRNRIQRGIFRTNLILRRRYQPIAVNVFKFVNSDIRVIQTPHRTLNERRIWPMHST